jgi:hypothetical protein
VKGNRWLAAGNPRQPLARGRLPDPCRRRRLGPDNDFSGNVADLGGGSGVGSYLYKDMPIRLSCSNPVSGVAGLSNRPCS